MPSVRIENDAFGDGRYARLALEAGLADADHALGKMARLWRQCTAEGRYVLPEADVNHVLGARGVNAILLSRLGDRARGGIRIKGTKGRIEWLETKRKNGRKGGRPKKTGKKPSGLQDPNPLALALALAPAHQRSEILSGEPDGSTAGLFPDDQNPDRAQQLALIACEAINTATGTSYQPSTGTTLALCRTLAKRRITPDQVRAVIEAKVVEWHGNPDMSKYLRPATLLAPKKFHEYLDDLQSRGPAISSTPVYRG